ncbi:phage tail tape measure protein [uncultured Gilvimarinus sp.]|uniref:phage tail tape measure protein n=1 Tax=uncultured Gilvimarinus sp. TaxID=1689143 RepID=UPI0030D754F7
MAKRSLGTLTLDLIAQIGGFEKGMDKANRKSKSTMGSMQKHAKAAAKAVAGIGIAAVGATAALVKSQANAADELMKTSRAVGVEVETLSALKYQAELSGVQFNNLATGLRTFSKNARDASEGTGEAVDTFDALGISLYDSEGRLKSTEVLLGDVANSFSDMEDGMLKTAAAQDLMGRSGGQMINLLNGGADGIADMRREAEALGVVLDAETGKAAEDFNDALTKLNKSLTGNYDLLGAATPAMKDFTELMNDPDTLKGIQSIVGGVGDLIVGFVDLSAEVANFVENMAEGVARIVHGTAFDDLDGQIKDAEELERKLAKLRQPTSAPNTGMGGGGFAIVDKGSAEEIAEVERKLVAIRAHIAELTLGELTAGAVDLSYVLGDVADSAGDVAGTAGGVKKLAEEITRVSDLLSVDEFGFQGNENPLDPSTWNEAGDAVKEYGDEIVRVSDLMKVDEFGFSGNEDPFNSATWIQQADDVAFSWTRAFDAMERGIGSVRNTMDDSSSAAKSLGQAMQVLQVAQGVSAILNQGMGDPYTAAFRMMQMAASVSSLIGSVGFAGEGSTAAADSQAVQGTGSVFGDASADSESILNSSELTAKATSNLVDINRDMLTALQAMQAGISSATGNILRGGVGQPTQGFSQWSLTDQLGDTASRALLGPGFETLGMDFITDWLNDALGGSSDVINSGIEIAGGRITDLIDNTVVSAFQDVEEKKHIFDDKDVRRFSEQLGADVSDQFSLVFGSMVGAVGAAAEVLGVTQGEIDNRIAQFRVAATEISLKDLDGADQQAELEAVFSKIFDGLAGSVIPYARDFQQMGEGMAETLVRVATQVQVADSYMGQLGSTLLDGLSGQALAQMSDALVSAAGGVENFMSVMGNFVDAFATDEQKLSIATSSINSAFEQMGLSVPATQEGVWALMQTLTDPDQIYRLAELTGALETYYGALEKIDDQRQGLTIELLKAQGDAEAALNLEREAALLALDESNRALQQQIWALNDQAAAAESAAAAAQALSDFQESVASQLLSIISPAHAELNELNKAMAAQIAAASELGVSEQRLHNMRQLHQLQLLEFAAGLEDSIASLNDQLFGSVDSGMQSTVDAVDYGMAQIRESMIGAIEGVNDWLNGSLLSDVSPLTPQERLEESRAQFSAQAALALGGDVDALSGMRELADQFLSESNSFNGGSTQEFNDDWMFARDLMQQIAGIAVPDAQPTYDQQASIVSATESTALSAYEQLGLASDMVGHVAAYSRLTGELPADIADRLGVPMGKLIDIMGFVPEDLSLALDDQFDGMVTGFDMTIDPLLSVQQQQLDTNNRMADTLDKLDLRLERLEEITEQGVGYQAVTAGNTGKQAASSQELVASQRLDSSSPRPAARIS